MKKLHVLLPGRAIRTVIRLLIILCASGILAGNSVYSLPSTASINTQFVNFDDDYIDQIKKIITSIVDLNKKNWKWPVSSSKKVIRGFKPPRNKKEKYLSGFHRGIDIAAKENESVYAPADGVIKFSGFLANRYVISITHANGLVSSFEPVKASVIKGQRVTRGQQLGQVQTGLHTNIILGSVKKGLREALNTAVQLLGEYAGSVAAGPVGAKIGKELAKFVVSSVTKNSALGDGIHIGVRKNGIYINPLLFFGKIKPSVLLPNN